MYKRQHIYIWRTQSVLGSGMTLHLMVNRWVELVMEAVVLEAVMLVAVALVAVMLVAVALVAVVLVAVVLVVVVLEETETHTCNLRC